MVLSSLILLGSGSRADLVNEAFVELLAADQGNLKITDIGISSVFFLQKGANGFADDIDRDSDKGRDEKMPPFRLLSAAQTLQRKKSSRA